MSETQKVCERLIEQGYTQRFIGEDECEFIAPPERGIIKTKGWKILQRNRKWVAGCTITESVKLGSRADEQSYRRFTATIRGFENFKIWEGFIDRPCSEISADVIAMVTAVRDRIDNGDESDFSPARAR